MSESYVGRINRGLHQKQRVIRVATGQEEADLVLKNATYVNVFTNELCTGDIAIAEGVIAGIGQYSSAVQRDMSGKLVLPGLIDAHIHLESSLVSPGEFARAVVPHGTTTVFTDPHEIANVMGTDGIEYMLQATEGLPVDVQFMLPSCVPATPMDESGDRLDFRAIDSFYNHPRVRGLAEMMNFVGITGGDREPVEKVVAAEAHHKVIDGHAPDLAEAALNAYVAAGIRSDHECHDLNDAIAKLRRGQTIMIRDGTAARNLEALAPLLCEQYAGSCAFCTDDKHPNDLLEKGHIDYIVKKAIALGADPILAVRVATIHAARHFRLYDRGAVAPGYLADLAVIDSFDSFRVEQVYRKGQLVAEHGAALPFAQPEIDPELSRAACHTFHVAPLCADDFAVSAPTGILGMINGEITTTDAGRTDHAEPDADILKIAVIERHNDTHHIGVGFIQGYGLRSGAVATSVSHDSHNIIVVGTSDESLAAAANRIIEMNGGIAVWDGAAIAAEVPLRIAGIMSDEPLEEVNRKLECAKEITYTLGVNRGIDPFMTLSFMALPVIPTLRVTTNGVFNVSTWSYL